jgi:hypothetical protein
MTEHGTADKLLRARAPADTHYCSLEGKDFPIAQLSADPHWGIVHHVVPQHTATGTLIPSPGKHGSRTIDPPARTL